MMKKRFLVMFSVMLIGYGVFTLIQEMRTMNVMRWRKIGQEGVNKLNNTKVDFSKENFLASMMESCQKVSYADVVFDFTPDISHYAGQSIFLIESYASNFVLYKGKFNRQIVIKGVPYCTHHGYRSEDAYEDDYDMLAFRLFDLENQRAVFWGALWGYQYYNGKVNRVTLFRNHVDEYDGYYKVEQEDK